MRTDRTAAWRAVSVLAVLVLAAGLVGALGGGRRLTASLRALHAAASRPAAVSRPPVTAAPAGAWPATPPEPAPDAQKRLDVALTALAAGRPAGSISVAALDTATGRRLGWGADTRVTSASVFKFLLLEGYLLRNQDRRRSPGDGMGEALASMIEYSDNDAANQVYDALGGHTGVASTLHRLGLSATVLGAGGQWGLSTTTAADQLVALTDLVAAQSPLSTASQTYALAVMSDVESDQRWGVGAAADPKTGFANKNGWLDVDDDHGRWVANSVGVLQVGGHQVLLAVLTQHDRNLDDGIDLAQAVARAVATTLRDGH